MKEAVKRADESFPDWLAVAVTANRLKETNPDQASAIYEKGLVHFPNSVPLIGDYAAFLHEIRKDYDRAEEYYKKAIEMNIKSDIILVNYAIFLADIRKDYDRAEEYFKKAIELEPKHANNLGSYAGFLLSRGKAKEGLSALERVLPLLDAPETPRELAAECWFYAFAHRTAEGRDEALRNLKRALQSGDRSPHWDLAPNIVQARKDGHPDVMWLEKLAAVISEGADIGILDSWPKWKKA